jgi:hypothetical protein
MTGLSEVVAAEGKSAPEGIRRRIEARISQGEFIAGLLRIAGRENVQTGLPLSANKS